MTSTATMNTAAASTSTDSPPSTLIPNSLLQFQTEIVNESANETPPQEEQSQMDNAAAMNCNIQTLYQYTQQHPHDNDDLTPIPVILANPHGHAMTVTPPQQEQQEAPFPQVCQICGEGDSPTRRLCCFIPNGHTTQTHADVIHVFCGKTAAILPKINRPDLEISPKSGMKKKFGGAQGPILTVALQRARSAVVDGKIYYLTREVHEHVSQLLHQQTMSPSTPVKLLPSSYSPEPTTAPCSTTTSTTTPNYTNPRPPPETMEALKKITPPSPPPRKKLKTMKSPYELLMQRLQAKSNAIGGIGYSLVRGVSPATDQDDHAEQEEENFNPNLCSQTQVDHVRILIVTQDRQEEMTSMARHFQKMSETSTELIASHVWDTWRLFQCKYRNQKCWNVKLNMLLGFTDAIKDYDEWMVSTAYPWNDLTLGLGRLWKALLKKEPEELGVDVEFTLPAILCLLQDFQEQVESVELQFQYQVGTAKP